jgi:hypothetical protein
MKGILEHRLREGSLKIKLPLRISILICSFAALALLLAPPAAAQGCAMCYQNAAASGAQGSAALRHGILVLLVPTVGLFLGIFGLFYSRRNVAR